MIHDTENDTYILDRNEAEASWIAVSAYIDLHIDDDNARVNMVGKVMDEFARLLRPGDAS